MNETDDHQDLNTENAIDALVSFNSDMRKIAMNAYQMKDLLAYVQEENDLLLAWLEMAEQDVILGEEQLAGLNSSLLALKITKKPNPDDQMIEYLS
jgi:hypothetical protein